MAPGDAIATPATAPEVLLNGTPVRIDGPPSQTTLLDFLRERGLTGAKEGCAEGECGACMVALVSEDGSQSAYRAVNSCLMFLPMAAGHEIYTVESLATDGRLADAQQAMAAAGGSQCGYCTPGFVISLFVEQHRRNRTGPCDPMALSGNLCRCTGYRPIVDAARALGPAPEGPFRNRLERPGPVLRSVDLQGFSRPETLDECLTLLAADSRAAIVAGATDMCVESNLHHRRWPHLVSIEAIDELRDCSVNADRIRIGAALPLADIPQRWHDAPDVIHQWLSLFASPPIRNRATLGGNLATASPIGDAAPLLLALDAKVEIAGASGRRTVPISSFFVGYRKSAVRPGEIVTAIEIPAPLPRFLRFYKAAKRRLDDISTVAAAMALDLDGASRVASARFAFGGVAATPVRAMEAEAAAVRQAWNETAVERIQHVLQRTLMPKSDHRGSALYRLEVAKALVEKFWWETRP